MATFRFKCSYMNCTDYEVHDETGSYIVETRNRVCDYERSVYNGGPAEIERDLVGAIGKMHRNPSNYWQIPAATVHAFNAWRKAEHEAFMAKLDGAPERYGEIAADDPLRRAPMPMDGAHYEVGEGWVVDTLAATEE